MRKGIFIVLCLFLAGCSASNSDFVLVDYSKGDIISNNDNVIKINNTSYDDFNNYIEYLKTITYNTIINNDNYYCMSNGSDYISLEYIDSLNELYNGYNVVIDKSINSCN